MSSSSEVASSSSEVASSEDVMSGLARFKACAGCWHLRRKCVPDCAFAPYFSPEDRDRFAAVHSVFGASNVSKMLAELEPEQRADAVESLVYQAMERQRMGPSVPRGHGQKQANQQMAEAQRAAAAAQAAREQAVMMQQDVAAPQCCKQAVAQHGGMGRGFPDGQVHGHPRQKMVQRMAQAPESSAAAAQAAREQAMMTQQAAAAQQHRHPLAQHEAGLALPDGRVHGHLGQQIADAQKSAAKDELATWQDTMGHGASLGHQLPHLQMEQAQQLAAAEEQYYNAAELYTVMGHDASLGHQLPHLEMEQAQQLAAAEAIAREQDMMIQLSAAAAGLTTDEYRMMMMMQQQDVAGGKQHHGEAEQYAALGLTRDQNMTMMQQAVAEQEQMAQQIANAQQLSEVAWEQELMMMQQQAAAEVDWEQELMMMQQQAAAEVAWEQELMMMQQQAMPGSGSGATIMPFLPGGSANADAFLVQPQGQPQPQTVSAQVQEESSLPSPPPWLTDLPHQQQLFLPGGSADAEAFLVQQQPQPQPQTVNAFGSQVEHALPPLPTSLADLPRQQPNDGGDEGQSSDLIARYWNQYPDLPPDGRQ